MKTKYCKTTPIYGPNVSNLRPHKFQVFIDIP
jgi:hypothetical protein